MSDLTKPDLPDDEREMVKENPHAVASEKAWRTSTNIIMTIMRNNGIPNGRLIALEVDKALSQN